MNENGLLKSIIQNTIIVILKILISMFLLIGAALFTQSFANEITPSDVYAQVLRIATETILLKKYFNKTEQVTAPIIEINLKPRHVWSKMYVILIKISLLRRLKGLMYMEPTYIEPAQEINPSYPWEQTQRILTEIAILKRQLGISGERPKEIAVIPGKRPLDVFNKLNQISYDWTALLGGQIKPDIVYGEAMRLNSDIDDLLLLDTITDSAIVPKKIPESTSHNSLQTVCDILIEIQRLQLNLNIQVTDLNIFCEKLDVTPEDVFDLLSIALIEIQTIKAQRNLIHNVTPGAVYVRGKTPADVRQLLTYILRKLKLIRKTEFKKNN